MENGITRTASDVFSVCTWWTLSTITMVQMAAFTAKCAIRRNTAHRIDPQILTRKLEILGASSRRIRRKTAQDVEEECLQTNKSAPKEKAIIRSARLANYAKALSHTTPYLMVTTMISTASSATIENLRLLAIVELGVRTGSTMSPQVCSDIHSKLSKFSGPSGVIYSSLTFQGFLSFSLNVNISCLAF